MMPSRGLAVARSNAPRLIQRQCRNLSSTSRSSIHGLSSTSRSLLSKRQTLQSRSHLNVSLIANSVRFASTAPATPPAQSAPPAASTEAFPNLDTITLDNINLSTTSDITNIPEHIGYLSKIGIDFGYGVTSSIQWILEYLHIYAGLPWWAAIAATAVAVRVVTFPFYLKSSDSMARQNALVSVTKPITDRMTAAQRAGDTTAVMAAWQELGAIRKNAGIRLRDQFVPPLLQGVIGFCGFRLMRAMATMPVPGLLDGGFLWLSDLTITDGYLITPALMAASVHLLIRLGGESANAGAQMPPAMKTFMLYGMPSMIAFISAFQPGAVLMWFVGSGSIGIVQALLLQNRAFRARMGLAPIYKPAPGEAAQGLMSSMLSDRSKTTQTSPQARMRPTYQAPNLTMQGGQGRTIDASLVTKTTASGEDMVQPEKKAGVFGSLSKRWTGIKQKAQQAQQASRVDPQEDYKRRAKKYEEDWQKAHRAQKGGE